MGVQLVYYVVERKNTELLNLWNTILKILQ